MKKTRLKKLGHLYATDEMLCMAEQDIPENKKIGWQRVEPVFQREVYLQSQICDGILVVAIYLARDLRLGSIKPLYEIFIDKSKREYLTWDTLKEKWRTACVEALEFPHYYSYSCAYMTPEDKIRLTEYLGVTQEGMEGICQYQQSILEERLENRYKKETSLWEAAMKLVPNVPKDWLRWVNRHGLKENFIFYDYSKNVKEGFCTWCEKTVPVKKARHNTYGTCTCCGHRIQYKAKGKAGRLCTKVEQVYLPQKYGDGLIIRQFTAQRFYQKGEYETPEIMCNETGRVIYDKDLMGTQYYYGKYKQRGYRWIKGYPNYSFFYGYYDYKLNHAGAVYKRTVPALSRHILSRTGLPQLISSGYKISPNDYLSSLDAAPYLERFIKAGLKHLTLDALKGRIKVSESHSLAKSLGIDGNRLGRLRNNDGGELFLIWMQYEKKKRKNIVDSVICYFEDQNIRPENIKFIQDRMSELRICNYLKRQYALTNRPPLELLSTWQDYLNMSKRLKRDITLEIFYKPKNLVESHDEVLQLCEDKNITLQAVDIAKVYPDVDAICESIKEKYEYRDQKYVLLIPNRIEDIIQEGRALRHCIRFSDDYYERIQRRESYIAFLRKADQPEKSFYTLEFEPDGTVRQKRTSGDRQNVDFNQAVSFIKKWQKAIQPRLTEEDYRLAKVSASLRVEEFKELRKKNAKVWHGHLAGMPLADVLEADLMEVSLCIEDARVTEADGQNSELVAA